MSTSKSTPWTLINTHGLEILGDTHVPAQSDPIATAVLLHGFKGYKDYGFLPVLAHDLCENSLCDKGMIVHRFNFATSGMTNDIETFARPDLFELDTWNRQVEDVACVIDAIHNDGLRGNHLPLFLIGHSRGGATALLSAARHHQQLNLAGVVTINAVDQCCTMSQEAQNEMRRRGFAITQSARTKQELKIGSEWLTDQLDHPDQHNVLKLAQQIPCPVCVIHCEDDLAVEIKSGIAIANSTRSTLFRVRQGDHVLNMSNPSSLNTPRSRQLLETEGEISRFITERCSSMSS